jgi:hypothetical protein
MGSPTRCLPFPLYVLPKPLWFWCGYFFPSEEVGNVDGDFLWLMSLLIRLCEEKPPRLKATDREALPVIQERLRAETVLRSQGKRLRRQV